MRLKRRNVLSIILLLMQTTSMWAMEPEEISPENHLANTQHYQVAPMEWLFQSSQDSKDSQPLSREIETGKKPDFSRYCGSQLRYTFLLDDLPYQNQDVWSSSSESAPSASDDENYDENPYYYSSNFNDIIAELCNFNLNNKRRLLDSYSQWEKLHTIGDSFVNNAIIYGQVIIKERGQPLTSKTITRGDRRNCRG